MGLCFGAAESTAGRLGEGVSLPIRDEFWASVLIVECETLVDEKVKQSYSS